MWNAAIFVALSALHLLAHAHSGGLNGNGCHNNRQTGDYHCHRGTSNAVPQAAIPRASPADPRR
jgi:hypothetical protein